MFSQGKKKRKQKEIFVIISQDPLTSDDLPSDKYNVLPAGYEHDVSVSLFSDYNQAVSFLKHCKQTFTQQKHDLQVVHLDEMVGYLDSVWRV